MKKTKEPVVLTANGTLPIELSLIMPKSNQPATANETSPFYVALKQALSLRGTKITGVCPKHKLKPCVLCPSPNRWGQCWNLRKKGYFSARIFRNQCCTQSPLRAPRSTSRCWRSTRMNFKIDECARFSPNMVGFKPC